MKVNTRDFAKEYTLLECIQCGRCTGGCPVSMKTALNIRGIIYEMLVEDQIDPSIMAVLWDCTNCLTCTTRCPKDIKPADVIIGLRGYIVGEGKGVPPRVRDALMSAFTRGNTLGFATEGRDGWTEGLDFEVANVLDAGETDLLFYVGCTPAYDPRVQPVTRALARVFQQAGIEFGTMGIDEQCCGNEIRRIGEAEGFADMVAGAHEMFAEFQAQRMVAVSPHCYNAFHNEYGQMPFPVQHYTQLMAELLDAGHLGHELLTEFGGIAFSATDHTWGYSWASTTRSMTSRATSCGPSRGSSSRIWTAAGSGACAARAAAGACGPRAPTSRSAWPTSGCGMPWPWEPTCWPWPAPSAC